MATYQDLGIKKVINAAGTYTKYSGSLMSEEVLEAMKASSNQFVDIDELLKKSGKYIADLIGVEAALVTAGAATGLVLATATCVAGEKKSLMRSLPDTEDAKNEIVVMRCHRNPYDQAMKLGGGKFIEIGNAIETHPWELEESITEKTAAVAFFVQSEMLEASLSFAEVIDIAHKHNVPVIVDAAAELPPAENLTKYVELGAEIVLFSGGKDLRGPQSSGLMLGKQEYIDSCRVNGYPHHSVGRPMKLDKETIMGFVRAIELYLEEDHQLRRQNWELQAEKIADEIKTLPGIKAEKGFPAQPLTQPATIPRVFISFEDENELNKIEVHEKLLKSDPSIVTVVNRNSLVINPHMLQSGEEEIIIEKLRQIILEKVNI